MGTSLEFILVEENEDDILFLQRAWKAGDIPHSLRVAVGGKSAIGYLDLAIDDLPPEEPVQENLRESQKAAYRAAKMSGLMLSLLGQQPGAFRRFGLSEFGEAIRAGLEEKLPGAVALEMDLPADGPSVRASRDQLKKMLEILVENAGEAMAESDAPDVTVSMGIRDAKEIPAQNRFPGEWEPVDPVYAAITVQDGGRGMDPDFVFAWPHSVVSIMGPAQAGSVLRQVAHARMEKMGQVDENFLDQIEADTRKALEDRSHALANTARLWDDGLIDPRDTRSILGFVLDICQEARIRRVKPNTFGIARM